MAVFRAKELKFQGAGRYREETVVPLDNQGIVLIRGEEGSGKSMLAEVLTINVTGKGSPRVRKDRLRESQIANEGGYYSNLSFESGEGTLVRAVQTLQAYKHPKHKSRYDITLDGEKKDLDGKPAKKKLIRQLVPLTDGEWHSVVYLHQGGTLDLIAGTIADKRDYITSVFGLDFYQDLVDTAKAELSSLQKSSASIRAETLEQERADIKERIREFTRKLEGADDIDELKAKSDRVFSKLDKLNQEMGELSSCSSQFEKLRNFEEELSVYYRDFDMLVGDSSDNLVAIYEQEIDAAQERAAKTKAALDELEQAQKSYDNIERRAKKARDTANRSAREVEEIKEALEGVPSLEEIEAAREALGDFGRYKKFFKFDIEKPKKKFDGDWIELIEQAKQTMRSSKEMVRMAEDMAEDATCPTCKQPVDVQALEEGADALKDKAKKTRKKAQAAYLTSLFAVTDPKWTDTTVLEDIADAYKEAHTRYRVLPRKEEQAAEDEARAAELEEELAQMTKPKPSEDLIAELQSERDKIDDYRDHVSVFHDVSKLESRIEELQTELHGVTDPQSAIKDLEKKISKGRQKHEELVEKIASVTNLVEGKKLAESDLAKHEDKLESIGKEVERTKMYEDEIVPYFTTLRTSKVRSSFSVLETVLPVYLAAMTSGNYEGCRVEFDIADDLSKVNLQLQSNGGAPLLTPHQSSGGQRQRFGLAMSAAFREVSPRHANFMFFDEPFVNLSADGKDRFVNSLLPTLMGRNPDLTSVFLVAHDEEVLKSSKTAFQSIWTVHTDGTDSVLSR